VTPELTRTGVEGGSCSAAVASSSMGGCASAVSSARSAAAVGPESHDRERGWNEEIWFFTKRLGKDSTGGETMFSTPVESRISYGDRQGFNTGRE
jgi:hypothetical protein